MAYDDKINLYISKELDSTLKQDMRTFEFFDVYTYKNNQSGFLNNLIQGYYHGYLKENEVIHNGIRDTLKDVALDEAGKEKLIQDIIRSIQMPENQKRRRGQSKSFPFKPREELKDIIMPQIHEIALKRRESIQDFIIQMLICYIKKPLPERERIIFHKNYEELHQCCETNRPIVLTTKWDRDSKTRQSKRFHVIPWAIASGPEEIHNYLLCQLEDENTHLPMAGTFALHRIQHVEVEAGKAAIDPDVEKRLEKMRDQSPAYAINSDETIKVKLSHEGVKLYHRIYYGRPEAYVDNDDDDDDANKNCEDRITFKFKCSEDQAFFYFRRFDPREVEVRSPASLRERMKDFFQSGLDVYHR